MSNMKTNEEILNEFILSRNTSKTTKQSYNVSFKIYSNFQKKSLDDLLIEAEQEEEQKIRLKDRNIKTRLLSYRQFLTSKYTKNTVRSHFNRVLTLYRHYEIEIPNMPYFNNNQIKDYSPIFYKDLPDKTIIKEALKLCHPLMRAIILFQSSSGCARRETLNLTIQDFIYATSEYHNSSNIYDVINELKTKNNIVPTFKLKRQKTNKDYYTFCSPEAVESIINYLIQRTDFLRADKILFKINTDYYAKNFARINDTLNLGKKGAYNRFRSHMLRKFHASNLNQGKNALTREQIDELQGRRKDSTHSSYFMEDPNQLKQAYIEAMDKVTINLDVNTLTIDSPEILKVRKENEKVLKENQEIKENIQVEANKAVQNILSKYGF